jgi:hypothetical protein
MKKPLILILGCLVMALACGGPRHATSALKASGGDTRTIPVKSLDASTFELTETTNDKTYGFDRNNPVKVGSEGGGPSNERRYLNALLGPNGEAIWYNRSGSCCAFKTPNGLIDNTGMLDHYKVTWTGAADTLVIFINMYDKGDLKIPVGFTAKKK